MTLLTTLLVVAAAVGAACTKPNPAVCCLDAADCDEIGITEPRPCNAGIACVDHKCQVPSCAEAGCAATAPVCNTTTDVCDPCASSDDCTPFADAPVCETTSGSCLQCLSSADCVAVAGAPVCEVVSGSCVQCVAVTDCNAAMPICDANACRPCRVAAECASGACGDSGACVVESSIIYLDPGASDTGSCTRAFPCRTITYGISLTSPTRNHLVMAPGGYTESPHIDVVDTLAAHLFIHGGGATLTASSSSNGFWSEVGTTIRDLDFLGPDAGYAISLYNASHVIERVRISNAGGGVSNGSPLTLRDVVIAPTSTTGIAASGNVTLDRVEIRGGGTAITSNANLDVTNLLAWGQTTRGLDIANASGTIVFSTIADVGSDFSGPRAVVCGPNMTIRSSIIWAPVNGSPPVQGCTLVTTIAGPPATANASNADPRFLDVSTRNYHLAPNSPARDAVDTGPATDFEGDARPQGVRFDIGADEAAP